MNRLAGFALVACSLALAACGSAATSPLPASAPATIAATDAATDAAATDDASLAPPPDACSLLTQREAETLAQEKLQAPVASGAASQCMWTAPPTAPGVGQVQINVGDGAKKQYDIDNVVLKHDFKPVPNLGDEAYVEDGSIFVRKGDLWFSVILVSLSIDDKAPGLIKAAQIAVTRV